MMEVEEERDDRKIGEGRRWKRRGMKVEEKKDEGGRGELNGADAMKFGEYWVWLPWNTLARS